MKVPRTSRTFNGLVAAAALAYGASLAAQSVPDIPLDANVDLL